MQAPQDPHPRPPAASAGALGGARGAAEGGAPSRGPRSAPGSPPSPAAPRPAELALRDRIVDGDRGAAEAFFGEHLEGLYEFVHYRLASDRAQVEDVVQDTFVVALEKLPTFDGHSTLHTWLCGIAKNKIRALRRRRRPLSLEDALESADAEIDAILARIEREPLPDWALERQETQELVGATLSSLPPDYRRALVEKYVDGLTVEQISHGAGKGLKATESVLHRARLAFGRVFELLAKRRGGLPS